jgi:hypothetical protein
MNHVAHDGTLVGFRPEHMLPVDAMTGRHVRLPFHVDRIEYLSGDRHAYGTVSGLGEDTRVIARLPATVTAPLHPDETYDFACSVDKIRYFDSDTGRRTDPIRLGDVRD